MYGLSWLMVFYHRPFFSWVALNICLQEPFTDLESKVQSTVPAQLKTLYSYSHQYKITKSYGMFGRQKQLCMEMYSVLSLPDCIYFGMSSFNNPTFCFHYLCKKHKKGNIWRTMINRNNTIVQRGFTTFIHNYSSIRQIFSQNYYFSLCFILSLTYLRTINIQSQFVFNL